MAARNRFFFAFLPPRGPRGVIARLGERIEPAARHVADDRLHLTLTITEDFGDYPNAVVDALIAVGDAMAADPVAITLDRISGSNRSVALRPGRTLPALHTLEREMARRALDRRVPLRRRTFAPHVTMLYRGGRPFVRHTDPVGWTADELVLIHSALGKTRHRILGRWRLSGGGGNDGEQLSLFD